MFEITCLTVYLLCAILWDIIFLKAGDQAGTHNQNYKTNLKQNNKSLEHKSWKQL